MTKKRRWFLHEPVLFFFGALVFRGIFLAETREDPFFSILAIDARSYFELALRFAAGDRLYGDEALWFPPLYPTLLGVLFGAVGPDPFWARAIQLVFGAATAAIGTILGARISPVAGRVSGAFLALSPLPVFYENQLLLTGPALFASALFLLAFLRARSGEGGGLLAGLALGLLGALRSNALVFAPIGALWLVRSRGGREAAAFVVGVLLTLVPVLLRNGVVSGVWTPATVNGGMIFATGFAEGSLGGRALRRSPQDFGPRGAYHREAEELAGRRLTLAEASRWHRDRAWERIRDDPGWALGLTAKKLALLVNSAEIDDNLSFAWSRERSVALSWLPKPWAWMFLAALLGTVIGLARPDPTRSECAVLVAFLATYAAVLLLFFVNARYRLPVSVPGAVLGGVAVDELVRILRRRAPVTSARTRTVAFALVALSAFFVLRDPGVREDPALGLVAIGAALEREGNHARALEITERALEIDASIPGGHLNRATSLMSLGRDEEALAAAAEAARLEPGLAGAWLTQGAILARRDRVEEALPLFERAAALEPENPDALGNLAQALALTGSDERAVEVGRRAIELGADWIEPGLRDWERRLPPEAGSPRPRTPSDR